MGLACGWGHESDVCAGIATGLITLSFGLFNLVLIKYLNDGKII